MSACTTYTLRWSVLALAEVPPEAVALSRLVCMVARPNTPSPVRAVVEQAAPVVAASGAEARAFQARIAAAEDTVVRSAAAGASIVVRGMTTALRLRDREHPLSSATLLIALADDHVDLVLATDVGTGLELAQLTACPAQDSPWLFAWPRRTPVHPNAALAVLVELAPTTEADCAALLAAARAQAEATGQSAAANGLTPTVEQLLRQRRERVLEAIATDTNARRPALLQLAQESGAPLTTDLALVADSATLDAFGERLAPRKGLAAEPLPMLAFELEIASYRMLLELGEHGSIQPALAAVLTTHAGEAGSDAGALHSILDRATDLAWLARLIVRENLSYLGENDPVRRVNAFDWLARRGSAPPGYDPLGERAARRKALRAYENAIAKRGER
jgi:hypothetical protein